MGAPYSGESPFRRVRRIVSGNAPAVGADWTVTVPAGFTWRLVSVIADLTTSAAVANRDPHFTVSDGTTVFEIVPPSAMQAASLTRHYIWFPGADAIAIGAGICQAIPELVLPAGFVVASNTVALDVGDQWTKPVLHVIETTVRDGSIDLGDVPDMVIEVVAGPGM